MTGIARRVGSLPRAVRWYLRELTDESAYDRYLAHHRTDEHVHSIMTRREFERWRVDRTEGKPGARCC